jgi:hypothetical protein
MAFAAALRHAEHVDEKGEAFVRLRSQKLNVTEMSDVEDGFSGDICHAGSSGCPARNTGIVTSKSARRGQGRE